MTPSILKPALYGLLGILLVLGVVRALFPDHPNPVRLSTHVWPGYELLSLALDTRLADPSDFVISRQENALGSMNAIRRGDVDAATLTLDEVLSLRAEGADLRVIHVIDVSHGADAVVAREAWTPGEDLRGKRIAVEDQQVGGLMLDSLLRASNLSRSDVTIISVDDVTIQQWNDNIDVLITYEPIVSALEQRGAHKIFDSAEIPFEIVDVLVASKEAIESNPDGLTKLVEGYLAGRAAWINKPMDSQYRLAKHLSLHSEQIAPIFAGLLLPEARYVAQLLGGSSSDMQGVCELLRKRQELPKAVCSDVFTADLLPSLTL